MRNAEVIAADVLKCVLSWEPGVRVLGNVTGLEVARLLVDAFTACPACGAEPWCDIDCRVCGVMHALKHGFPVPGLGSPQAPAVTALTCARRELLDTDEDQPTGPVCGKPATYRVCDPAGAPACSAHKCRCNTPLTTSVRS